MRPGGLARQPLLKGLITDVDLRAAEVLWPGLSAYLSTIPESDRPPTFLQLIWLYENRHSGRPTA